MFDTSQPRGAQLLREARFIRMKYRYVPRLEGERDEKWDGLASRGKVPHYAL